MAKCAHHDICGREAEENDGEHLCILHSKDPNKDKDAFERAFDEHYKQKGRNFAYFGFPAGSDLSEVAFTGDVSFEESTFHGLANFLGATFHGFVNFEGTTFEGYVSFAGATFSEESSFEMATCKEYADFAKAEFAGYVCFQDATFHQTASFGKATFSEIANFQMATFKGYADFRGATFRRYADFDRATFGEDHNSSSPTPFSRDAGFSNTTFSGYTDFHEATFNGIADFFGATFSGHGVFEDATFSSFVDFERVAFEADADFFGATFKGYARFWKTTFSGHGVFEETTFNGDVDFWKTTFNAEADFTSAQFTGKTVFDGSRFKGRTLFLGIRADDEATKTQISPGVEADFTDAIVDQPDGLIFRDADLRKWRFLGTDVRKAEFTGVTWPEIGGMTWKNKDQVTLFRIRGRVGVYDEIASVPGDEVRKFAEIERLYRELKQNFEERRDSDRAGDFHYGEKETRRLNPETPRWTRWLLFLYRVFSGYGERYLLPLRWATGLFLLGTWVHYVHVISPTDAGQSLVWTNFSEWGRSAIHTVRAMFLLKPTDGAPTGVLADGVSTALSLLGPLFLGLLALAIRQRLRR